MKFHINVATTFRYLPINAFQAVNDVKVNNCDDCNVKASSSRFF